MRRDHQAQVLFAFAVCIAGCGGGGSSFMGSSPPVVPTKTPPTTSPYIGAVTTLARDGFFNSFSLAFDPDDGNTYVAGQVYFGDSIARVTPQGQVNVILPMTDFARGIVYNPRDKQLYVTTFQSGILRVSTTGMVSTFLGGRYFLSGIAVDPATGTFYVAEVDRILKITAKRQVSTFSPPGKIGFPGGPHMDGIFGLTFDTKHRQLLVADTYHKELWRGSLSGSFSVVAGHCVTRPPSMPACIGGQRDGRGSEAQFLGLTGVAYDPQSNMTYVADGNRVRSVSPAADVATLAGSGALGATDGIGTAASFAEVNDVSLDERTGLLYAIDTSNGAVRIITTRGRVAPPPPPAIGQMKMFALPTLAAQLGALTFGADGNVWFGEGAVNRIGRMTPSGTFSEFRLPAKITSPGVMTLGPDGNVWFGAFEQVTRIKIISVMGRIDPSGSVTFTQIPTVRGVNGIIVGPDQNIWFTDAYSSTICKMTVAQALTCYPVSRQPGLPTDIAVGTDGNFWVSDFGAPYIHRITTQGTATGEFPITFQPFNIAAGPDGRVWYVDESNVGAMTTSGKAVHWPLPCKGSGCFRGGFGIASSGGALWITENNLATVSRVSTSGVLTDFPVPTTASFPNLIVDGPDGNAWFTDINANEIGRITTHL